MEGGHRWPRVHTGSMLAGQGRGWHWHGGNGWTRGRPLAQHLSAAVLQHHVHVVAVSEVSVEGHDVVVPQAAVQGDLALHLWPPHMPGSEVCHSTTLPPAGRRPASPGHCWPCAHLPPGGKPPSTARATRHHLESKHGAGGHVCQLVAAAEGALSKRGLASHQAGARGLWTCWPQLCKCSAHGGTGLLGSGVARVLHTHTHTHWGQAALRSHPHTWTHAAGQAQRCSHAQR